ncbi:MAG: lamin tail domain-containing protein, partial [Planctomycetes bacterium]|nr:lamin tail domain-containing protein [Planctomycetota bacterium]
SWRASAYSGGSPGSDDSGIIPNPGDIVINELLARSHRVATDWIELYNTTDAQIDIGGWYLSDSNANLMKYRIADGTEIDSGQYLVFYKDANFGELSTDPGKMVGFALSENGGAVYLSSAEGDVLMGYREAEDFGASATGVSFGRYFKKSTGNYNFVAMSAATPWLPNAYPKVGPIVINEIMYHPNWPTGSSYPTSQYEYIELFNSSAAPVKLYDDEAREPWRFTDGIDYTFPPAPGITIPAGGYLLVVKDMTAYLSRYGIPPFGVLILGPYDGKLSNGGEKLELSMPGNVDEDDTRYYIRVDRVNYSDGSHPDNCPGGADLWPTEADGGGKSLTRTIPANYGNDPNNWKMAGPTPGLQNP